MYGITNECIEKELEILLEKGSLNPSNIRWFNDLCKAMWNLSKMRHSFTEEDAKEWAKHMDPPPRWTMEQTSAVMAQNGYYPGIGGILLSINLNAVLQNPLQKRQENNTKRDRKKRSCNGQKQNE